MNWVEEKYINLLSSRLRNFKRKKQGLYNCSCPLCGDSQKNKLKARGFFISKNGKWFFFCHNCGASKSFDNFLKDTDTVLYKEYSLECWKEKAYKKQPEIIPQKVKFPSNDIFSPKKLTLPTIDSLPDNHIAKLYVKNRKIPEDRWKDLMYAEKFGSFASCLNSKYEGVFPNERRLVIPFFDENGDIFAATGRALDESSVRYVKIDKWNTSINFWYGIWRKFEDKVYVTEGPLDSLFLPNAVATCGLPTTNIPKELQGKTIVFIFDNEPRNKNVINMMKKAIDVNSNIVIFPDSIKEKDINEMILSGKSIQELQTLIDTNTFSGMEATLRFNRWKKI